MEMKPCHLLRYYKGESVRLDWLALIPNGLTRWKNPSNAPDFYIEYKDLKLPVASPGAI